VILRHRIRIHSAQVHAVFLLALAVPYFINLGTSSIWDASEAFYAETPREMIVSGDYLAPHFNFEPRAQKPPLTYWIVAISYKVFGISEFALRLPGALAAVGIMLFSYGIARLLHNPPIALMTAAVTATTARVFILARRLPIDILLLLFLTGTLFFIVRALKESKRADWAFAYLFMGLGVLTKGPVAVAIPVGAILIWSFVARRPVFKEARIPMGILIFLTVVIPWYVTVFFRHGWTYIAPFFLKDNLARFASESFGPARGIFYYFSVVAADYFPWSILSLWGLYLLWIRRKQEKPFRSLSYGLPLIWCVFVFALFSLSKNKQEYYIAPIYPVASVLLAAVFSRSLHSSVWGTSEQGTTVFDAPASFEPLPFTGWIRLFAIHSLLFFMFALPVLYVFRQFMPGVFHAEHYIAPVVMVAASLLLAWNISRKKPARCFLVLVASIWALNASFVLIYLPALERYRPVRTLCALLEPVLKPEDEVGYFRAALPSMVYYLRRPIFEETDFERMNRRLRSEKRVFCIMSERDYKKLAPGRNATVHILARRPRFSLRASVLLNERTSPNEELLLLSNRPGSTVNLRQEVPSL
jgi:4-amino-4-deoxy-L-arabinose transferase-like glycosyltransferase